MANENYGSGQFYGGATTLSNVAINSLINYTIGGVEATLKYGLFEILDRLDRITPFNIGAQDFGPFGSINYWEDIYASTRNINQQLGISSNLSRNIEINTLAAYKDFVALGGEIDDLTGAYRAFTEMTSTNRLLTKEQMLDLGQLRTALGEGFEQIFANLALYGKSIDSTSSQIKNAYALSNKMGVNASGTLKTLKNNINALDRFTFRRGIEGLTDMVMLSERYKINMESAFGFIEQSNSLENAIEQSAQLLALGGKFSQLADPFTLMFTARNNPEQLIKSVTELAGAYAYLDEQAGEFRIDPYGMDQLRAFKDISGIAVEELSKMAKIDALTDHVRRNITIQKNSLEDFEETVNRIAAAAYFDKNSGQFGIDIQMPGGGSEFRTIAQIDKSDLESIQAIADELSLENVYVDLINTNETLVGSIDRLINTFKRYTISDMMYKLGSERVQPLLQDIKSNIEGNDVANTFKYTLEALDEGIFNNLMSNLDAIDGQFSTSAIFGVSKEEISQLIKNMSAFFNDPLGSLFGSTASTTAIGPSRYGFMAGEWMRNKVGGLFGASKEEEPAQKPATQSIIKMNSQNLSQSQEAIIKEILNSSIKFDKNFNNKIEFGEFTGAIKILTPNNKEIDEVDLKAIFSKIKPQLEAQIQEQIYDEIENNNKNSPKRARRNF